MSTLQSASFSQENIIDLLGSIDPLIDPTFSDSSLNDPSQFSDSTFLSHTTDYLEPIDSKEFYSEQEKQNPTQESHNDSIINSQSSSNFATFFELPSHQTPSPYHSDASPSHSSSGPSSPDVPIYLPEPGVVWGVDVFPTSNDGQAIQPYYQEAKVSRQSQQMNGLSTIDQILSDVLDPSFSSSIIQPNGANPPAANSLFSPNFLDQDSPLDLDDTENDKIAEIFEDVGVQGSVKKRKRETPDTLPVTLPRETLLELSSEEFAVYAKKIASMRKLTTVEKKELRRQMRLIKNREYAQQSRQKKKTYVVELEGQISQLVEENNKLKQKLLLVATELRNIKSRQANNSPITHPSYPQLTHNHPQNQLMNKNHQAGDPRANQNPFSNLKPHNSTFVGNHLTKTCLLIVLFAFALMFVPPPPMHPSSLSTLHSSENQNAGSTGRLLFSYEESWWRYAYERFLSFIYFGIRAPFNLMTFESTKASMNSDDHNQVVSTDPNTVGEPLDQNKNKSENEKGELEDCREDPDQSTLSIKALYTFLFGSDNLKPCQKKNQTESSPPLPPQTQSQSLSPQTQSQSLSPHVPSSEHSKDLHQCKTHRCDL